MDARNLKVRIFAISLLMFPAWAHAQQGVESLIRMPRLTAMGGAGVGLADDEYALFTNPAGLAGLESRRFHLAAVGLEAPLQTYETLNSSITGLRGFDVNTLNALMGKEIYLRSSITPMFILPHFVLAYVFDFQGSIEGFNQANPSFQIGDMITHGVQAGMGWSLKSGRHPTDEWRIGISGKMLFRRGGYFDIDTAGFLALGSGGLGYINSIVGGYGTGYGADAGIQYVNHLDRGQELMFGASITDIAGTRFSDPRARTLAMNPSVGFGYVRKLDLFKWKLAADFRNLDQPISFANKTHIGTELTIPLFDFYAGLNQTNLTYGAAFDIWILKLTLLSYAEELGVQNHQLTSRRYMLQVDFNLPI